MPNVLEVVTSVACLGFLDLFAFVSPCSLSPPPWTLGKKLVEPYLKPPGRLIVSGTCRFKRIGVK